MSTFHLQIVTPDGCSFDGEAEFLTVRTIDGMIGIKPQHIDYVTALGMGEACITTDGTVRRAACIGGMLAVTDGKVKIVATTFEWASDIDVARAKASEAQARALLEKRDTLSASDVKIAEAKLKRALVRESVGTRK